MSGMDRALKADGEKMRALTGQDHGPFEVNIEAVATPHTTYQPTPAERAIIRATIQECIDLAKAAGAKWTNAAESWRGRPEDSFEMESFDRCHARVKVLLDLADDFTRLRDQSPQVG